MGVVALLIIGIALFWGVKSIYSFFSSVNPQTLTTLFGITIPLLASIVTVYLARRMENKKAQQEKIREFKIPIYNDFIENTLRFILIKGDDQKKKDDEMASFIRAITPKMMIWADDKVLKEWADFRTEMGSKNSGEFMMKFEDMILAIRKDLGHDNKKLNNHELLKCFINDLDDHLAKKKT